MKVITNFVAFQIGWFACVLGGANNLPWLGVLVVAAILVWHLKGSAEPQREAALIALAGIIGGLWDSALVASGWLSYPSGMVSAYTAPYWMVAMWMLFATTLNVSMRWLKNRYALAALLGAVAGPMAYAGGGRLGGLTFHDMTLALAALAAGWAVFMPLLMALSNRFDGVEELRTANA